MYTLAAAMAQILRDYGCSEIYGIGGDYAASLIQGLDPLIELCPSSNETNAGYSACASAELNGVGCCLTTFMVGSIPCLSAAALAMAENLAVVFISGAPGDSEVQDPVALHHSLNTRDSTILLYNNAVNAFRGLGVRAERLSSTGSGRPTRAEQFADLVRYAAENRQPVFVEVPRDVVFSPEPRLQPKAQDCRTGSEQVIDRVRGLASEIHNRLSQAHNPIVYFGDKLKHDNGLRQIVLQFCRQLQIPFAYDPCAKGILNDQEPLSLGVYNGSFSDEGTRLYVEHKVDFVLEIGTSRIPRDICVALKTGTQLIYGSPRTFNLSIECVEDQDEGEVLQVIMQSHLHPFGLPAVDFEPEVESVLEVGELTVQTAMNALVDSQNATRRPYIFLPEIGSAFFASFKLPTSATSISRGWLSNPWYGAMGTSLPYARVVSRAVRRNRSADIPVVIIGDGGLHFQLNELTHFQREHLPVLIVLFRNNVFGLGKSSSSSIYDSCSPEFKANKMIEAYGGKAVTCSDGRSLRQELDNYNPGTGIMLIEIPVSQDPDNGSSNINKLIKASACCLEQSRAGNISSATAASVR